jgi:membrane fusion protein
MRLDASIQSIKTQLDAVAVQRDIQVQRIAAAEERRQTLVELYQKGNGTKIALLEQEEVLLAARQALADLDRQQAVIGRDLEEAQLQREQLPDQTKERLSKLRLSLAERERERTEVEARGAQVVRAPIAGRVTALQVSPGQIIDADRPLLTLVPEGAELRAELFVPSRAIGFVQPGQQVRLMMDAFPYQQFGSQDGAVESISQVVLAPNEVLGKILLKEPSYRVTARLKRQKVQAFGRQFPLQPDMSVQADIVLERRSLLAWLFEPLLSVQERM